MKIDFQFSRIGSLETSPCRPNINQNVGQRKLMTLACGWVSSEKKGLYLP